VSWLRTEGGLDHHVFRLVHVLNGVFGTALFSDCRIGADGDDPVAEQRYDDCFFDDGRLKSRADIERARIAQTWWIPKLDWFTLTYGSWLGDVWLAEGGSANPLARTHLAGVDFVGLPESWRAFGTARFAFRRTWCEREGLPRSVCGDVPFAGPDGRPVRSSRAHNGAPIRGISGKTHALLRWSSLTDDSSLSGRRNARPPSQVSQGWLSVGEISATRMPSARYW
jgi:hypothetical protein